MADDRLNALDASFLVGEDESAPMNIGGVDIFSGPAPSLDDVARHLQSRLHLLPHFRQRIAKIPLGLSRPRWVDDDRFRISYHLRHTALPEPGRDEQLQALFGRILEQPLDRRRPLWEVWLVEGLAGGRFAVLHKFHHTLVDGIASVDVLQTMFDAEAQPADAPEAEAWSPRRAPSQVGLLARGVAERAFPPQLAGSIVTAVRRPRRTAARTGAAVAGLATVGGRALRLAPRGPYNRKVGPHRRFAWQREALDDFKAVKDALDGSLNDVVLTAVAGALGAHLRGRGEQTAGLELQVFVPVALRSADGEQSGNEVSGLRLPLPVGETDPLDRFARIHAAMDELKDSAEVVAGSTVIELSGLAPPAIGDRVSALGDVQRYVNLIVTNVPGPPDRLYLLGRELDAIYPLVPLGANLGLGVAICSYAGGIFFGFTSDPDIVADVAELPALLHRALAELAEAAGVDLTAPAARARDGSPSGDAEPWPGYDEQTVAEIRRAVAALDAAAAAQVGRYEREHKDRKGVREAVAGRSG